MAMRAMLGGLGTTDSSRPPPSSSVRPTRSGARDAWLLIEAATVATMTRGLDAPESRAGLDRMLAAFWPAGGVARVRAQGTCEQGDGIAAALFEAGVRAIEIEAGVELAELEALVGAIVRCVHHALHAPFEPRRPALALAHVELRTAPVGETGDFVARERRLEAARPIESAALAALARAPADVSGGSRRSAEALALARLSRDGWDTRFATLAVDAALAQVGQFALAGPSSSGPSSLGPRPRSRPALHARVFEALAARRLEGELAGTVHAYLESALAGTEVTR
jgi:hypothetical protein